MNNSKYTGKNITRNDIKCSLKSNSNKLIVDVKKSLNVICMSSKKTFKRLPLQNFSSEIVFAEVPTSFTIIVKILEIIFEKVRLRIFRHEKG